MDRSGKIAAERDGLWSQLNSAHRRREMKFALDFAGPLLAGIIEWGLVGYLLGKVIGRANASFAAR